MGKVGKKTYWGRRGKGVGERERYRIYVVNVIYMLRNGTASKCRYCHHTRQYARTKHRRSRHPEEHTQHKCIGRLVKRWGTHRRLKKRMQKVVWQENNVPNVEEHKVETKSQQNTPAERPPRMGKRRRSQNVPTQ